MLREAEIKLAGGQTTGEVCRALGIAEETYYRWRKEYGGMQVSQARRLKDLERENARLKKLVADQALDKAILEEALKVPQKQPKRPRLWLNDGSCVRLRPTTTHHVWSYDFVMGRTQDGRAYRMLTVIDHRHRRQERLKPTGLSSHETHRQNLWRSHSKPGLATGSKSQLATVPVD